MEFVGGALTIPSGADGTAEEVIELPTSETELFALLVHQIQWFNTLAGSNFKAEGEYQRTLGLYRGPGGVRGLSDPATIAFHASGMHFTETALTNIRESEESPEMMYYNPPILIAHRQIYFAGKHAYLEVGSFTAKVRLGYTLEKVSREAFIAALVG